jgi:hypothetical protein
MRRPPEPAASPTRLLVGWLRRVGRRTWALGGALALAAATVGLAAGGAGPAPVDIDVRYGAAWLPSPTVGLLTLIGGETAEVMARVKVGVRS